MMVIFTVGTCGSKRILANNHAELTKISIPTISPSKKTATL